MKRSDSQLLAGLILFVIGAAVLVYGIVAYNQARASLGNAVHRLFLGSGSQAEQQSIIEMIGGGAVALVGLILVLFRRSRGKR